MKDEEITGAKFLVACLTALIQEVRIAANASSAQDFLKANVKFDEDLIQTKQHNYVKAIKLISEAISLTTTSGNTVAEILREKA